MKWQAEHEPLFMERKLRMRISITKSNLDLPLRCTDCILVVGREDFAVGDPSTSRTNFDLPCFSRRLIQTIADPDDRLSSCLRSFSVNKKIGTRPPLRIRGRQRQKSFSLLDAITPLMTILDLPVILFSSFILDKKIGVGQPKRIENAKILVANTPMDTDKIKIYGARVRVDSMSKVADIEAAEKDKMRAKCEKIIGHGINCFVNRQLIYNFPEEIFADAGVMAIEHADFDGIERLALVTGGEIVSTFDDPSTVKLGHCKVRRRIRSFTAFRALSLG
jgi:hypothetical protein